MEIDLYKIKKLRGSLKDKRVFLIGNGPSVRFEDLESLKNEVCFCANRFHLCYQETSFRPSLTFIEDKKMIDHHFDEIGSFCESPLLVPSRFVLRKKSYENLIRYSFLTKTYEDAVTEFSSNLEEGFYSGSSVVFGMLQMAAYMEAKEIILYGLDHSFEIPKNHDSVDKGVVIDSGEKNHFISAYRDKNETWCRPREMEIEQGFTLAREYLKKNKVKIWNATRGGCLEIFKRKSLEDFLSPGFFSLKFSKKKKKEVLLRFADNGNQKENDLADFLKDLGFLLSVSKGKNSDENLGKYDFVISSGDLFSNPIEHKNSYYFLSHSIRKLSQKSFGFENSDFLRSFIYYDTLLVSSSDEKEQLLQLGVSRRVYVIGKMDL